VTVCENIPPRVRVGERAERRLAKVVDEGQERGEIAANHRPSKSVQGADTYADLGLDRRRVREARLIRDAYTDEEIAKIKADADAKDREMSRSELLRRARKKRKARERKTTTLDGPQTCSTEDLDWLLAQGWKFGTVYADPPWAYGNQATRASTGNHYETMTVEQIAGLPVEPMVADNAHLHLWTTNAFLFEAREVIEAWGFEYKSAFVWAKPQMGMGNYWRVSHEYCLLGVRGSTPFLVHDEMSWQSWPRGQHSRKPGSMYRLIERVSPGPYLEVFARQQRDGWVSWGNEIEKDLFYRRAVNE